MDKDGYITFIEDMAEEADIVLSSVLLEKVAVKAMAVENLSLDDIYEELADCFPNKIKSHENFEYFLDELSAFVLGNTDENWEDDSDDDVDFD